MAVRTHRWTLHEDKDLPAAIRTIGVRTLRGAVQAYLAARVGVDVMAPRETFGQSPWAAAVVSLRHDLKARRIGSPLRVHDVEGVALDDGSAFVIVQQVQRAGEGAPRPRYQRGAGIARVLNREPQLALPFKEDEHGAESERSPVLCPDHRVYILGIEFSEDLETGSPICFWWVLDWTVLAGDVITRGRSLEGEPVELGSDHPGPDDFGGDPEPDVPVKRKPRK